MYFWNYHALAEELRCGSLTEKQKMLYLLIYLAIFSHGGSFTETTDTQ
jgi:hypothetical protein